MVSMMAVIFNLGCTNRKKNQTMGPRWDGLAAEHRCEAFGVLTSLCISDICLANCVSAVSGRSEYKFLPISLLPSSLYFT